MPRRSRKSSGSNAAPILGLVGGLAFILTVGVVVVILFTGGGGGDGQPKSGGRRLSANQFSTAEYLENANALRGNIYQLECRVEEQLRWTRDRGRLFSVAVEGASPVGVLVPQDLSHVNIERNSRLVLIVEVGDNGLLLAKEVRQG